MEPKKPNSLGLIAGAIAIILVLALVWHTVLAGPVANLLVSMGMVDTSPNVLESLIAALFIGGFGLILPAWGLRQSEGQLVETESTLADRLRKTELLFDVSGGIFIVFHDSGEITSINPKACQLLGHSRDGLVGKNFFNTLTPLKSRQSIKKEFTDVPAGKGDLVKKFTAPLVNRSKFEVEIDWKITRIKDEAGQHLVTLCFGQEASEPEGPTVPQDVYDQEIKKLSTELVISKRKSQETAGEFESARKMLSHWVGMEKLINPLLVEGSRLSDDKRDATIDQALAKMGSFLGIHSAYIFLFNEDATEMDNTHIWSADLQMGEIEKATGIPLDEFPWFKKQILARQVISVAELDQLPPQAKNEKAVYESQGIASFLNLPMISGDRAIGYIGFEALNEKRWREEEIIQARLMGQVFAGVLKPAEPAPAPEPQPVPTAETVVETHYFPNALSENLIKSCSDGVFIFDRESRFTEWNPKMEELTGLPKNEVLGKKALDLFPQFRDMDEEKFFRVALDGDSAGATSRSYAFQKPDAESDDDEFASAEIAEVVLDSYYSPIQSPKGDIVGGLAIFHEVTDPLPAPVANGEVLNNRIEELTRELENANSDLAAQEEFQRQQDGETQAQREHLESEVARLNEELENACSTLENETETWKTREQTWNAGEEELKAQIASLNEQLEQQKTLLEDEMAGHVEAMESAREERQELENKTRELEEQLQRQEAELQSRIQEHSAELETRNHELEEQLHGIRQSQAEQTELAEQERQSQEERIRELTEELESTRARIDGLIETQEQKERESAELRVSLEQQIKDLTEELVDVESRLQTETTARARAEENVTAIRQSLEMEMLARTQDLENERDSLVSERDQHRQQEETYQQEVQRLEQELRNIQTTRQENQINADLVEEAEDRYRTLSENSGMIIVYLDSAHTIADFNQETERVLGWQRDLNIGNDFFELVLPQEIRATVAGQVSDDLKHHALGSFESALELDGNIHLIQWNVVLQGESEDEDRNWVVIGKDITEIKQFEKAQRENDVFINTIIQNAVDAYVILDETGAIHSFNPSAERLFKMNRDDALRQPMYSIIPDPVFADPESISNHFLFSGKSGGMDAREFTAMDKSGDKFSVDVSVGEMYREGHRMFLCIIRDVTETKRLESALRESEDKFRQLLRAESDALVVIDPTSKRVLEVNDAALELYGYGRDEMLSLGVTDISAEPAKALGSLSSWVPGQINQAPLLYHKKQDGTIFLAEITCGSFRIQKQSKIFWLVRDITERKRAEDQLKDTEVQLQVILNSLHSAVYLKDMDGRYLMVNKKFETLFHVTNEKIRGRTDHEAFSREIADDFAKQDRQLLETGLRQESEETVIHGDGAHTYHMLKFPLRNSGGNMYAMCGIATDITQQLRNENDLRTYRTRVEVLERALSDTEGEVRSIVNNISGMVSIKDKEGRYRAVNGDFETLFKKSNQEVHGKTDHEIFPPEIADEFAEMDRKALQTGERLESVESIIHEDGPHTYNVIRFPLRDSTGEIYGVFGLALDITEQQRTGEELVRLRDQVEDMVEQRTAQIRAEQDQLLQREKMNAVADLSLSIANQVNTPIYGIRNVLEQVLNRVPLEDFYKGLVDLGLKECGRVTELTHRLQECFSTKAGKMVPVRLHQVLDDILQDINETLALRKIEVERNYSDAVTTLDGNPDLLKQALRNIIDNAEEAISKGKTGYIRISTDLEDGQVIVHVQDNGCGIPPKNQKAIFNPFFTTKSAMKRTGMGLSSSFGIIKGHGGTIQVQSQPAKGTTLTIALPLTANVQSPQS